MEVVVEDLLFERDGRTVLDLPRLRFAAGRRTAILGPNGAGKTTLLRLIAALERPARGEIRLDGRAARPDRATRLALAFVFQEPVFLSRSVRANLELGLELRGIERAERARRIEQAAARLGISHLLERRATQLSGGEARRAGLCRALCLQAPLALLDEPLAGLDPATRVRLFDELPELLGALAPTQLLVTHDREEALRLGEDLVILIEGRLAAAGPALELVRRPPGAEVARILGYVVLELPGVRLAVAPGGFRLGPGTRSLRLAVDEVVERVEGREAAGRIGTARVRVELPADARTGPGETLEVHAPRAIELPA